MIVTVKVFKDDDYFEIINIKGEENCASKVVNSKKNIAN